MGRISEVQYESKGKEYLVRAFKYSGLEAAKYDFGSDYSCSRINMSNISATISLLGPHVSHGAMEMDCANE